MRQTRTIRIQLKTTPEQAALLHHTMQEYTACFNEVCQIADEQHISNGVELHRLTYACHRASTSLPAQLVCAARVKATEAIKSVIARRRKQQARYEKRCQEAEKKGKRLKPLRLAHTPHSEQCALRYDARSFRFDRDTRIVSLVHVQQEGQKRNRALIAVNVPLYYEHYLTAEWEQECADLLYRQGAFWLHVVVSTSLPAPVSTGKAVGIDLGISRLAVTSQQQFFGGTHVKETNNRSFRLRRSLQAKGTKSAKRHLKRMSDRQRRFQADVNHGVAKRIVASVSCGDTLAMENLTDIRERTRQRREQRKPRREHANWSFAQLQRFVAYKAAYKGVNVQFVDARYSSKACSRCGHIDKRNRKCQSEFSCVNCHYQQHADLNAAYNLASRATSAASGLAVKKPLVSTGNSQGQASSF